MHKLSNVASDADQIVECPSCGSVELSITQETESFQISDSGQPVTLSIPVNVYSCNSCDLSFSTEDSSENKHNAICHYFGVLAPREVRAVREQYEYSQAEFSELSKIGKASLNRWETGLLIQNQANDNLLFLLTFRDNFNRLKNRYQSKAIAKNLINSAVSLSGSRFRCLTSEDERQLQKRAEGFKLFFEPA